MLKLLQAEHRGTEQKRMRIDEARDSCRSPEESLLNVDDPADPEDISIEDSLEDSNEVDESSDNSEQLQLFCERSAFSEELDMQEEQELMVSDDEDDILGSEFTSRLENTERSNATLLNEGSSLTLVMQYKTRQSHQGWVS